MKIELGRVKEPVSSERKEARCCAGMEDFAFDAAIRDSSQMQPTADGATEGKAAEGTVSVRLPQSFQAGDNIKVTFSDGSQLSFKATAEMKPGEYVRVRRPSKPVELDDHHRGKRPRQPAGGSRMVGLSITITPTATKGTLMEPEQQLAMVRALIFAIRPPPGVLQRWLDEGCISEAFYSCELGDALRAHVQAWEMVETTLPQTLIPPDRIAAAKKLSGKKRVQAEQSIRNDHEKALCDEVRARLRTDVIRPFFDSDKCSYTSKINVVEHKDLHECRGYPGKERGQVHHVSAMVGIMEDDLEADIDVRALRLELRISSYPCTLNIPILCTMHVHHLPLLINPIAGAHLAHVQMCNWWQLAIARAAGGRAAAAKLNAAPGASRKQKVISRKALSHMARWFEWRQGYDLLDLPPNWIARHMVAYGYQLDASTWISATVHERCTARRLYAHYLLHKRGSAVEDSRFQPLVDIILFGESSWSLDSSLGEGEEEDQLGRLFAELRVADRAPPLALLRDLTVKQLREVQRTGTLPNGQSIQLRDAYKKGFAVVCDLDLCGVKDVALRVQEEFKGEQMKTKSFTARSLGDMCGPYITCMAVRHLLSAGVMFHSYFTMELLLQGRSVESILEVNQVLGLDGAEAMLLGNQAVLAYASHVEVVAPCAFLGVLTYDLMSKALHDSLQRPVLVGGEQQVYVAVVRQDSEASSSQGPATPHFIVVAWMLSSQYVGSLSHGTDHPPGFEAMEMEDMVELSDAD